MDSGYNKARQIVSQRKEAEQQGKQKYKKLSADRLQKIATTKVKTSFIGALDVFEESFGFLWGQELDRELTPAEEKIKEQLDKLGLGEEFFFSLWQDARTNVLHNGNNQLRALVQELGQYSVHWNRYQYEYHSKESEYDKYSVTTGKLPVKPKEQK